MNVIDNIKKIRTQKGISHEAMALQLNISQATYTKLENQEIKLTVERLLKIAEILEVKVCDLLNVEPQSFHQDIHDNESVTAIAQQKVEHLYQTNKEIYEQLLASKDEQIALLKSMLDKK
jgi:transcriptional regulator with XRE-family HTH domain